jgi:hypothetical protein
MAKKKPIQKAQNPVIQKRTKKYFLFNPDNFNLDIFAASIAAIAFIILTISVILVISLFR